MKLIFALLIATASLYAQSDCGNCWSVGYACNNPNKDSVCYIPSSGCQECAWYFVCDDMTCNYSTGTQCWCPASFNQPLKKSPATLPASLKYSPIQFRSFLKTPITIDRRITEVKIKNRFWWKKIKV